MRFWDTLLSALSNHRRRSLVQRQNLIQSVEVSMDPLLRTMSLASDCLPFFAATLKGCRYDPPASDVRVDAISHRSYGPSWMPLLGGGRMPTLFLFAAEGTEWNLRGTIQSAVIVIVLLFSACGSPKWFALCIVCQRTMACRPRLKHHLTIP